MNGIGGMQVGKMVRRILSLLLILLMMVRTVCADPLLNAFETLEDLKADGLRVTVSARAIARQPYSSERLEPLNALLKYLSLETALCADGSKVSLRVDGSPALTWIRKEDNEKVMDWLDSDPDRIYTDAQGNGFVDLFTEGEDTADDPTGMNGSEYRTLFALSEWILKIPEQYPDRAKTGKIRTKIGEFGTAVEKITYTIPKTLIDDGSYVKTLEALCTDSVLEEWLKGITFSGKQTLVLYRNEAGQPIRFVYAGNLRYADGKLHSLNLNWKTVTADGQTRDSIILKSPATSGNDRDYLTVERTLTVSENSENLDLTWSYTRVRGKTKTVWEGTADLIGTSGEKPSFAGELRTTSKTGSETETGWILKPDLTLREDGIDGTLEISQLRGDDIPEAAVLTLKTATTEEKIEIPAGLTETALSPDETGRAEVAERITLKTVQHLILPLLTLPTDALVYFNRDLTDQQWAQVLDALGQ